MKLKNGILSLALFASILITSPARAVIFPDEAAATYGDTDEENPDAVSRFGGDGMPKKKVVKVTKPLTPISENSFERDMSRSPASVVEGNRGPAGGVEVQSSDTARPKKVIISEARRAKSVQEIAVIANENGFYPSTLFLTQGIPVRIFITGASAKSQCFMLDQFGVRRQVRSQKIEEVTFIPDQAGTFSFNCPMNGAKGSVVVKELEIGNSVRMPASVSVSRTRNNDEPVASPEKPKKSEIQDTDFTPEFRNN